MEESECNIGETVFNLHCKDCNNLLTQRSQKTTLKLDTTEVIYPSDFATQNVREGLILLDFPKCECKIRDVFCVDCQLKVGYHVIIACERCTDGPFLPFYWMFYQDSVKPTINQLYTWKNNPAFQRKIRIL